MNRGNFITLLLAQGNHVKRRLQRERLTSVGMISCEVCGAAILLDSRDPRNQIEAHNEWHEKIRNDVYEASVHYARRYA